MEISLMDTKSLWSYWINLAIVLEKMNRSLYWHISKMHVKLIVLIIAMELWTL